MKDCQNRFRIPWEEILRRFSEVHGDKYTYDESSYVNNHTKMRMYCSEKYTDGTVHGWFEKSPHKHISQKQGCPYCTHKKHTVDTLKHTIQMVHGDKYDLSNITSYQNNREYIFPICHCKDENGLEHGEFKVTVHNFLKGRGCPKCGQSSRNEKRTKTTEQFISEAKEVHGDKYDYSETIYTNSKEYLKIICHEKDSNGIEHGLFEQMAEVHLRGAGCPKCGRSISTPEIEISSYIENELGIKVNRNDREALGNLKELDIFVPSKNVAFEYDGMIWHSEKFRTEKTYHLNKTNICKERCIKLFHIYESEYNEHKDIVLNKISYILGCSKGIKVGARKCGVKEITKNEALKFLDKFHLQGFHPSTVYLGGFYNNELIGVMSFKKYGDNWELTRFATDSKYICQGLAGKLFKYFTSNFDFNEIKSFADRRWTVDENNNLYIKLGFELDKILKPDYSYTSSRADNIHKFNFRKQTLHKKYDLPLSMTETEMTKEIGYYKIWNCGLLKFVFRKK